MKRLIENGTTVLLADKNMYLTNGSSFVSTVRLGKEDSGTTWYEITAEEYQMLIQKQIEELI